MEAGEQNIVVDLVLNVFNEFVAPQYSDEGIEEFKKFVNAKAVENRYKDGNIFILAKDEDKTVGVIGFGNIGRRVAKLCYCFGANIVYSEKLAVPNAIRADMKAKPVSLNELLKTSDIVSLHVPSDPGGQAFMGWEQLCLMKPTAYLINTSRGSNIDETALIRALDEKKIAGAALDVWKNEPPDPSG